MQRALTVHSQVEHTITEELTRVDLVQAQLSIACGGTLADLGLSQDKIRLQGFSIQCRVTTEIPLDGFRPDNGTIGGYRLPVGNGIRLDFTECFLGARISPFYDSLLLKCICTGSDRKVAIQKAIRALSEVYIQGIQTNIDFLIRLLEHPSFSAGVCWTSFIDDTPELFLLESQTRPGQGLMRFLADAAVNGTRIQGQEVWPRRPIT